jgi:hypothetical protein
MEIAVPYIVYILPIFLLLDLLYMYLAQKNKFDLKFYYFDWQKNIDLRISSVFKILSYFVVLSAFIFVGPPFKIPAYAVWPAAAYIFSVIIMVIKFHIVKSKTVS